MSDLYIAIAKTIEDLTGIPYIKILKAAFDIDRNTLVTLEDWVSEALHTGKVVYFEKGNSLDG